MKKTAFILSLFSLAMGVSLATETKNEKAAGSQSSLDVKTEQSGLSEGNYEDSSHKTTEEQTASADDQADERFRSASVKSNLDDEPAEEENADKKSGSTGPEKEDKNEEDKKEEDKKEEHVQNNLDLSETKAEPEEKESVVEPKSVIKKKKKTKRKQRRLQYTTTSHAAIQAERNQNGMQPQGCPTSSAPDSEAVAVVSDDTCKTS